MNRRLGKLQRAILMKLKNGPVRADEITRAVYQTSQPEQSQIVGVCRSIRKLEQANLVECGEYYSDTGRVDQFDHPIYHLYLVAWLPGNRPQADPGNTLAPGATRLSSPAT